MEWWSNLKKNDVVFLDLATSKERLIDPHKCAGVLLKKSGLNGLRIYSRVGLIYLYLPTVNYYEPMTSSELKMIVYRILCKAVGREFIHPGYVNDVVATFKLEETISFFGRPEQDPTVSVMLGATAEVKEEIAKLMTEGEIRMNLDPNDLLD